MDELLLRQVDEVIHHHGANEEALVEILRDLTRSAGHLTRDHMLEVAGRLRLPPSRVYSVASFYSMINLAPLGKHVVRFCEDAPCHLAGGRAVWDALESTLGISFGETTTDGQWSLLPTSCIGTCAVGPVMLVDEEIYGNLTPERVYEIIAQYRERDGGAA